MASVMLSGANNVEDTFDENLQVAGPEPKRAAKAKAKGKAKAKAKAGGRAEYGQGPNKKQPLGTCICPSCTYPKYPGSRFCSLGEHKRAWDNMLYQAKTRKDVTPAQREAFHESLKNDEFAGKEVEAFALDNPPELRRKSLLDFARFERIRGTRTLTADDAGDVPMTEAAFLKHCENVLGLNAEEASEYWKELYGNKSVQRDFGGFKGREQLWVPAHHMRRRTKEHYVDQRVVEGSENMKAPSLEQRDMLRRHLARQDTSFNDEHFEFDDRTDLVTPKKRRAGSGSEAPLDDDQTPEKVINLVRERTVLHRQVDAAIRKLTTDLKKQNNLCVTCKDAFLQHPPELKTCDRGLMSFARLLQFRQEVGVRLLGSPGDMLQLVPDAVAADSEAQATPAPATPATTTSSFDAAAAQTQMEEKIKVPFGEWLKCERVAQLKFWPGEAGALMSLPDLTDMLEEILQVQEPEVFLALKNKWLEADKALQAIPKAMKSAADDLSKHMRLKVSEAARDKKRHLASSG